MTSETIRPFRIDIPEAELADLRRRLAHTRLPDRETVDDYSQGVPLKTVQQADAPYVAGRSKNWLKLKCVWEQEFVIGGYTEPSGSRTDFGALLVGYYGKARRRYAGKVGTGYTKSTLNDFGLRLRNLEAAGPAFVDAQPIPRGAHWTKPELVAQIGFAEWTSDARLRQPRFLGLRDDKNPAEVVRERPHSEGSPDCVRPPTGEWTASPTKAKGGRRLRKAFQGEWRQPLELKSVRGGPHLLGHDRRRRIRHRDQPGGQVDVGSVEISEHGHHLSCGQADPDRRLLSTGSLDEVQGDPTSTVSVLGDEHHLVADGFDDLAMAPRHQVGRAVVELQ